MNLQKLATKLRLEIFSTSSEYYLHLVSTILISKIVLFVV